jgi:flagellar biosynthesis component FlhA
MKSKSELNMEIEKLEKELLQTKEHNKLVTALLLERNTQIDEAKKKADYYEAHYNVNYDTWLKQNIQIAKVNKFLNEIPAFALENEDTQLWFEKMKVALQEQMIVSHLHEVLK